MGGRTLVVSLQHACRAVHAHSHLFALGRVRRVQRRLPGTAVITTSGSCCCPSAASNAGASASAALLCLSPLGPLKEAQVRVLHDVCRVHQHARLGRATGLRTRLRIPLTIPVATCWHLARQRDRAGIDVGYRMSGRSNGRGVAARRYQHGDGLAAGGHGASVVQQWRPAVLGERDSSQVKSPSRPVAVVGGGDADQLVQRRRVHGRACVG